MGVIPVVVGQSTCSQVIGEKEEAKGHDADRAE